MTTKKIKAVIIDDEATAVKSLSWDLSFYSDIVELVASFTKPLEGLDYLKNNDLDLLLLDINMPEMDGLRLLEELGEYNFYVIMTTAYDQYALPAIKKEITDYLLKPIDGEELGKALDKVRKKLNTDQTSIDRVEHQLDILMSNLPNNSRIKLNSGSDIFFVEPADLLYLKSEGNYTSVFINDQKTLLVSKQINQLHQQLDNAIFIRTHNQYVINLNRIKLYSKSQSEIIMDNGDKIPVSRSRKDDLLSHIS